MDSLIKYCGVLTTHDQENWYKENKRYEIIKQCRGPLPYCGFNIYEIWSKANVAFDIEKAA